MKFICFGYLDTHAWGKKSPSEQRDAIDACFSYDDTLKKNGHWVHGEALEGATTLSNENGKVVVTDGPYAETKEWLGGLLIVEARDLNHAIQLISNHPGINMGRWEIRPAGNLDAMVEESRRRREAKK
jgi:hypothetical protein